MLWTCHEKEDLLEDKNARKSRGQEEKRETKYDMDQIKKATPFSLQDVSRFVN